MRVKSLKVIYSWKTEESQKLTGPLVQKTGT